MCKQIYTSELQRLDNLTDNMFQRLDNLTDNIIGSVCAFSCVPVLVCVLCV